MPPKTQALTPKQRSMREFVANGITDQQERFCQALVMNGLSIRQAALAAGYSPSTAEHSAYKLLQVAGVSARIESLTRKLLGSHAPLAVATLLSVMQDPEANAMARVRATEVLLDRAGFKPIERYEDVSRPAAMDADSLRARAMELVDELRRREAAANVIDVTPEPSSPAVAAADKPSE